MTLLVLALRKPKRGHTQHIGTNENKGPTHCHLLNRRPPAGFSLFSFFFPLSSLQPKASRWVLPILLLLPLWSPSPFPFCSPFPTLPLSLHLQNLSDPLQSVPIDPDQSQSNKQAWHCKNPSPADSTDRDGAQAREHGAAFAAQVIASQVEREENAERKEIPPWETSSARSHRLATPL
jgi:hypothetical protein